MEKNPTRRYETIRACLVGMEPNRAEYHLRRHRQRVRGVTLVGAILAGKITGGIAVGLYGRPAWLRSTPSPRSYPELTVSNGVANYSTNWTIAYQNFPSLGPFNVTTTFVENATGNVSTLTTESWLYPYRIGSVFRVLIFMQVTGNMSRGIAPTSVTTSVQSLNNSTTFWGAYFETTNPGVLPTPVNISGFQFAPDGRNETFHLANATGAQGGRYYFALTGTPEADYSDPANGSSTWDTVQLRATLGGLGQTISGEVTVVLQSTVPATGPYPG